MKASDMQPGLRYIVTKASKNGEFQIGDRVQLEDDGAISNVDAGGWMAVEDVPEATESAEFAIDAEWLARRKAELQMQLDLLNALAP
jgi:hypothetical protein